MGEPARPAPQPDRAPAREGSSSRAPVQQEAATPSTAVGQARGGALRPADVLALQRTVGNRAVQRLLLQRQGPAGGDVAPAAIHQAAEFGVASPSTALPHAAQIQRAFGHHDVGQVQAHVGAEASRSAAAMGAEAFATGGHVVFAGTPSLHTAAHEAAHVVQQRAGVQLAGGVGQVGDPYERNADAVADRVVAGQSAEALLEPFAGGGGAPAASAGAVQGAPVQR